MRKSFCYNTRIFASNHLFSKQLKRGCVISPDNGSKVGLKAQKLQKQHALKAQKLQEAARPERAEAPSPGHRPGYKSNQQDAL